MVFYLFLTFSKSKYLIVGLVSLCIAAGKITVNWGYWVNYARDIYFFWLTSVVRRYEEISTFCNFQDTRSCHFCIPVEYIQKQATKLVITWKKEKNMGLPKIEGIQKYSKLRCLLLVKVLWFVFMVRFYLGWSNKSK